jgi:chromosome segregation ATPase
VADPLETGVEEQIAHLQERIRNQQERIRDLEQALDQSLVSLEELRSQAVSQQFLEQQLASTEAIANVQQQAIHQLKLQFAQHKAELEARLEQAKIRATGEPRQLELGLQSDVSDLQQELGRRDRQIKELEAREQDARARIIELEQKLQDLEFQNSRQADTRNFIQQAFQELESERQQSQYRIAELERQAAEMQEQILSQAQTASEYETAIQHWKDRFFGLHTQLQILQRTMQENAIEVPLELLDMLAALDAAARSEPKVFPRTNTFESEVKVDVPEFLVRRRTYRRHPQN